MLSAVLALIIILVLKIGSFLLLAWVAERVPRLNADTYEKPPNEQPFISIIIPARNEQKNIERVARSCIEQQYDNYEIIVVDDHSTDDTHIILERLRLKSDKLKVIVPPELPPGWLGKNHALHNGALAAKGDFLLFIDADTKLHPACLMQVSNYMVEKKPDLLTIIPTLVNISFWERIIQPCIMKLILLWFPGNLVNEPKSKVASANGPFLLFKKRSYWSIGGHEALKDDIVEDLSLAKRLKRAGMNIAYINAPELQTLRMYDSLVGIVRGWRKNFYTGLERNPFLAVIAIVGIFFMFVYPFFAFLYGLGAMFLHNIGAVLILAGCILFVDRITDKRLRKFYNLKPCPLYLQFLGYSIIVGIIISSALAWYTKSEVAWKQRGCKVK